MKNIMPLVTAKRRPYYLTFSNKTRKYRCRSSDTLNRIARL
jgi:hypothetical protein